MIPFFYSFAEETPGNAGKGRRAAVDDRFLARFVRRVARANLTFIMYSRPPLARLSASTRF